MHTRLLSRLQSKYEKDKTEQLDLLKTKYETFANHVPALFSDDYFDTVNTSCLNILVI